MAGNQVLWVVLVCMVSLFATTVTMLAFGEVSDRAHYKIDNVGIDYGDVKFPHMASVIDRIYTYMYSVPVFLMYTFIFWMFKVAIYDHKYSTQDQTQYEW